MTTVRFFQEFLHSAHQKHIHTTRHLERKIKTIAFEVFETQTPPHQKAVPNIPNNFKQTAVDKRLL